MMDKMTCIVGLWPLQRICRRMRPISADNVSGIFLGCGYDTGKKIFSASKSYSCEISLTERLHLILPALTLIGRKVTQGI